MRAWVSGRLVGWTRWRGWALALLLALAALSIPGGEAAPEAAAFAPDQTAASALDETAKQTAAPAKEPPPAATISAAPNYTGEPLSLDFQDIEVRAVLQIIADFTGLNLVVSDAVTGRVTLRLKDVPWDQALDVILKTKGLDKRLMGPVLLVAPVAELKAQEELELASRQQLRALAPLETVHLEVNYANASDVFALLEASGGEGGEGVLSPRGRVLVDDRTNSIILTETAPRIAAFRELLTRLDVPVKQVLIEARIVTVNTSFAKSLGLRWRLLGADRYEEGEPFVHLGDSIATLGAIRKSASEAGKEDVPLGGIDDGLLVDLGLDSAPGSLALGLLDKRFLLELELDLLETEGQAEVIARPKVITADRQEASIASGTQVPYQEAAGEGATSTAFVEAVLGLTVRPRITPDQRIIMDLSVSHDSVGEASAGGPPPINTNRIKTQVLVEDSQTVVLGGVFITRVAEGKSRTPFLSRIPLIGRLFRTRTRTESESELLIFITPRLLPSR